MFEIIVVVVAMVLIATLIGTLFEVQVEAFIVSLGIVVAGVLMAFQANKRVNSVEVSTTQPKAVNISASEPLKAPENVEEAISRGMPIECRPTPFQSPVVLTEYYTEGQGKGTVYETKLTVHDKRTGIGYVVQYCKMI